MSEYSETTISEESSDNDYGENVGNGLYIDVSGDLMTCRCSYIPAGNASLLTNFKLKSVLLKYNIVAGVDWQAVSDFVAETAKGLLLEGVLLASGLQPVTGADEYLDLLLDCSAFTVYDNEEKKQVDMHVVQNFINVSEGEEIGYIVPAGQGTDGIDVTGQFVPSAPGAPIRVKMGRGIFLEGRTVISLATGRLCSTAHELSVEELYTVKGDVGFGVGTINFKGVVEVRGDVIDHFNVSAVKGLTVTGNIGNCHIVSDRDITFNGMEKGTIICGGTIRANFLHDVTVECAGDVIVATEIHNCDIKTLGRIIVDKGAIYGGSYIARGGAETKKLGSMSSRHTKLHAGTDYRDAEYLDRLFTSLDVIQEKAIASESLNEVLELRKAMSEIMNTISAVREKDGGKSNAKINVKDVMYENVQLIVGRATETVKKQINGAFTVVENTIHGGLHYALLSDINIKASDMGMTREYCSKHQHTEQKVGHA